MFLIEMLALAVITLLVVANVRLQQKLSRWNKVGYDARTLSCLMATLEATPDLIALSTPDEKPFYINPAGRRMMGIAENAALTGKHLLCFHPEDLREELHTRVLPAAEREGCWHGESTLLTADGRVLPVSLVILAHKDGQGRLCYYATMARDMTERRWFDEQIQQQITLVQEFSVELQQQQEELVRANTRLEALATTDGLTGLKNHRAFQERLAEEFPRCTRHHHALSLLLIDVDHFKQFNDTFGHPAGDEVLKRVASILVATVRRCDFVARYGGEEFVIILPETGVQAAQDTAERVRLTIAEATWEQRPITISIGISTLHPELPNQASMIEEADQALYVSKALGRNRVTHHSSLAGITV